MHCRLFRLLCVLVLSCGLAITVAVTPASASHQQEAMFLDNVGILSDPAGMLGTLRRLGVERVRLFIYWSAMAPNSRSRRRPRNFQASNPKAYPASAWSQLDEALRVARADHMSVDLDLGGPAPLWATGRGAPKDKLYLNWEPSGREYGQFVRAVGTRYSGNYDPATGTLDPGNPNDLPAVHFWSVWNEPDYGPSLAPQGLPGHLTVEHSPWMYRDLLDAAWTALHQTNHAFDTILFGEVAPRGYPNPENPHLPFGVFNGMKPLQWLRALYCVDIHYRQLRGSAAAIRGCPANAAGSRAFRGRHPALFNATGFADHPYSRWYPPNVEAHPDPDYSTLALMPQLERALDRLQRVYGSNKRFPIWDTEYGYITSPPKRKNARDKNPWVSPATAAYYLNWAEYISWRDPRIASTMQYLLADPLPASPSNDYGGFASGLLTFSGKPKATYDAYRLPLYLPVTTTTRGRSLEVWGCTRPSPVALADTHNPQVVQIQLQANNGGPFQTIQTIAITDDQHGYFDTRVTFPSSGRVRISWSYPPVDAYSQPTPVYSRVVQITIH
jgi:hypothetical protein